MRPGKTNFKNKFWVGQRVRVDFSWLSDLDIDIFCDTGVIKKVVGKFLRIPDLTVIEYSVRMDSCKYSSLKGNDIVRVDGEYLTPLE